MGRLNKLTAQAAKDVFSSYLASSKIKDYPIKPIYFQKQRIRTKISTIIFLGGSQGATAINNYAISVAPLLKEQNINIIHQTGKNDFEDIKTQYQKLSIDVDIFDFSTKLIEKMDKADFAISRAGASTIWELVALGIPTLFIPYPYAAANHQYYNAKYLLDNNLCFIQKEDELTKEYLINILQNDLSKISKNLKN